MSMRLAFEMQADNDEPSDSREEQLAYQNRLLEYWDVVNMSFSTSEQDNVATYPSFSPPKVLNRNWQLWCPIRALKSEIVEWMEYEPRVQKSIRLAFRRGLGIQNDLHCFESLEEWLEVKAGLLATSQLFLKIIDEQAITTRQFALARERIEFLLNAIYTHAKEVPYHPDFDREFTAKLSKMSLPRIAGFLDSVCLRSGLNYPEGHQYLADLVTDVSATNWIEQPAKIARARERLQASASRLGLFASAPGKEKKIAVTSWHGLLRNPDTFGMAELIEAFQAVNLLGEDEKPTSWGLSNKGAWGGALDALTEGRTSPLIVNDRAACRCLASWGVILVENTLRNNPSTRASDTYKLVKKVLGERRK